LIASCLEEWTSPHESRIDGRIISVTQAGEIANVLLGFDNVSDTSDPIRESWVDFHSLVRVNGQWKITNKTATHATRADWAADRSTRLQAATVS
jgi:hypothetical protein